MRKLVEIIRENFDLRPAGIIQMLDLEKTDLQTDSSLRSLWTYRCRSSMGEDRQSRVTEKLSVRLIYKIFRNVYGRFRVKRPFSCYT